MSRLYDAAITISDYVEEEGTKIQDACRREWGFEDWALFPRHNSPEPCAMMASAENNLCGGEFEDEFSVRMAKVVWAANKGPCVVELQMTCLENLPCETYVFDKSDYEKHRT